MQLLIQQFIYNNKQKSTILFHIFINNLNIFSVFIKYEKSNLSEIEKIIHFLFMISNPILE